MAKGTSGQQVESSTKGETVRAAATVTIAWTGSKLFRRVIEPYVWEAANGYEQAVDIAMAAKLLTYPIQGDFAAVEGQSLTEETLQQLAEEMGGTVAEVKELLGLNKTK